MTNKTVSDAISEILEISKNNNNYLKNIDSQLRILLKDRSNKEITVSIDSKNITEIKNTESIDKQILLPDIMVQQKVTYPNGNGAALATIEFFTGEKEYTAGDIPFAKTKTNQVGKWFQKLKPGKYNIKIFKHPTTDKPKIDELFLIEVKDSPAILELPNIK